MRESLTAARLEHPNVIPIYRAGEDDGQLFIAMRFVEGASLQDLIAGTAGGIPPGRAARIVARVADALDAAHARGLVHRDVKPANILIADPDGEEHVYLTDFGLSVPTTGRAARGDRAADGPARSPISRRSRSTAARSTRAPTSTRSGACSSTPSPGGPRSPPTTRRPRSRPTARRSRRRHRRWCPAFPRRIDEVVRRAMAKRPEDRFATAGELGRAALAARYDVALLVAEGDRAAADAHRRGLRRVGHARRWSPRTAARRPPRTCAPPARAPWWWDASGLGEWARPACRRRAELAVRDRAFRLALVLLPGAPDPVDPGLAYLAGHPWVDLRAGVSDALAAGDLVRALRGADVPAGLPADSGECPYRGLEAFREEDAALFFGREQDTAQLIERLRTTRFVAVLGPSGSGKSSLVRAGLLPAVRRGAIPGGEAWRAVDIVPGEHPLGALAQGSGSCRERARPRPPTSPPTSAPSTSPRPGRSRAGPAASA